VPGLRVGQVFVVSNTSGSKQFGVALAAGMAEITSVQADLLLTGGANGLGGKAKEMGQAQYAAAAKAPSLVPTGAGAPPPTTPQPLAAASPGSVAPAGLCAAFATAGGPPRLAVVSPAPTAPGERRSVRTATDGAAPADWIAVPAGRGVVVEALAGPNSPSGALALVTDVGLRYPVPSRDVLATLGYARATPQRLPAALVALLPSGPALDPAAAALA
jgi:Type VII secretion system ESX-1, transport TM domain B